MAQKRANKTAVAAAAAEVKDALDPHRPGGRLDALVEAKLRAVGLSSEKPDYLFCVVKREGKEPVRYDVVQLPPEPLRGESSIWSSWRSGALARYRAGQPLAPADRPAD